MKVFYKICINIDWPAGESSLLFKPGVLKLRPMGQMWPVELLHLPCGPPHGLEILAVGEHWPLIQPPTFSPPAKSPHAKAHILGWSQARPSSPCSTRSGPSHAPFPPSFPSPPTHGRAVPHSPRFLPHHGAWLRLGYPLGEKKVEHQWSKPFL